MDGQESGREGGMDAPHNKEGSRILRPPIHASVLLSPFSSYGPYSSLSVQLGRRSADVQFRLGLNLQQLRQDETKRYLRCRWNCLFHVVFPPSSPLISLAPRAVQISLPRPRPVAPPRRDPCVTTCYVFSIQMEIEEIRART